jgi:hypothetical protein
MWRARPLRVARAAQLLVRVDEESHAMSCVYTTKDAPSNEADAAWREVVASIFFDMELDLLHSEAFEGQAQCWDFGDLRLTRFESRAVRYQRLRRQCDCNEPQILVSVPLASTIEFVQLGRQIRCEPGRFLLEAGRRCMQHFGTLSASAFQGVWAHTVELGPRVAAAERV